MALSGVHCAASSVIVWGGVEWHRVVGSGVALCAVEWHSVEWSCIEWSGIE